MINFAYIALGIAIYFMVRTVFSDEEKRSAGRQLGNYRADAPDAGNVILKYSRPFFSRYLVPIVEDLKVDDTRKVLKRKLASAGLTEALTPDELYSFKLFLIIGFPALMAFNGGPYARGLHDLTAAQRLALALQELSTIMGRKVPTPVDWRATDWRGEEFTAGSYTAMMAGRTVADLDAIAAPINGRILFAGDNDELEITHRSYSRAVFAEGALEAARFVAPRKGFFNMEDVLAFTDTPDTEAGPDNLQFNYY